MIFRNLSRQALHIETARSISNDQSFVEQHFVSLDLPNFQRDTFEVDPSDMMYARFQLEDLLDRGIIVVIYEDVFDPVVYRNTTNIPGFSQTKPFHFVPRYLLSADTNSIVSFTFNALTTFPFDLASIPTNVRVIRFILNVATAFNGANILNIGINSNNNLIVQSSDIDLTVTGEYEVYVDYFFANADVIRLYPSFSGSTVGQINGYLIFQ